MLEGLKVVELATYIAAPGAGGLMADWGADVVKIESPSGDPMRRFLDDLTGVDPCNPVFTLDNRGKRSIVLDIGKPEGLEAVMRLARGADVFLTNVRPAALKRAGLDFDALHAANPRLIYASVTGYGLTGPDTDRPGFDVAAFWSRTGVASLTAPKGAEPFPIRTGMGDHSCTLSTVSAILAALFERGRTGAGRLVETSLLRSGGYAISSDMAIQLRIGRIASTRPRGQVVNPLVNFFQTADGRWICLLPKDGGRDWPEIAAAVGRPALATDPRFAKGRDRRANGDALVAELDAAFAAMSFDEAAERLDGIDAVWAPVQTPAQFADDPQAIAAGCFVEAESPSGERFLSPAGPARFPGADDGPKGPAPLPGQHTRAILSDLGFDDDAVQAMLAAGAAGAP